MHSRDAMTTTYNNMSISGNPALTEPRQPVLSPLWEADLRQELAASFYLGRAAPASTSIELTPDHTYSTSIRRCVGGRMVLSRSCSVTALGHRARKPVQSGRASTTQCSNPLDEGS
jgi:hypothetical protein